jgi:transaldolase
VQKPEYRPLLDEAVRNASGKPLNEVMDRLLVSFGTQILSLISGRVSTELDARVAFNTASTIARGKRIVALYKAESIDTEMRVLIKVASTWEGIEAARVLQQNGIDINLTLLFSFARAVACADAGVKLISPFVGRITTGRKSRLAASGTSQLMRKPMIRV